MPRGPTFRFYVILYLSLCLLINLLLVIYFLLDQSWWDNAKTKGLKNVSRGESGYHGQILTCSDINRISNLTFIRSGWTKAVYKGLFEHLWVAIKTVNINGHDMNECQNKDVSICYAKAANKITKEELLLKELKHPNIIEVYGSCMHGGNYSPGGPPASGVIIELGQPFDMLQILQMTFEQRLLIASGLIDILQHLSQCFLGPLLMTDFRRDQFVLVNGVLKLSDVDDIAIGETRCQQTNNCRIINTEGETVTAINCKSGLCVGYNDRINNFKAAQQFMNLLLPYGAPKTLESDAQEIVKMMMSGTIESSIIYSKFKELEKSYSHGNYLSQRHKKYLEEYDVLRGYSLSDGDFQCSNTMTDGSCIQSVTSEAEAAWICHQLPQCIAFFNTKGKTWTGRQIAIFKKNIFRKPAEEISVIYVRRGEG